MDHIIEKDEGTVEYKGKKYDVYFCLTCTDYDYTPPSKGARCKTWGYQLDPDYEPELEITNYDLEGAVVLLMGDDEDLHISNIKTKVDIIEQIIDWEEEAHKWLEKIIEDQSQY